MDTVGEEEVAAARNDEKVEILRALDKEESTWCRRMTVDRDMRDKMRKVSNYQPQPSDHAGGTVSEEGQPCGRKRKRRKLLYSTIAENWGEEDDIGEIKEDDRTQEHGRREDAFIVEDLVEDPEKMMCPDGGIHQPQESGGRQGLSRTGGDYAPGVEACQGPAIGPEGEFLTLRSTRLGVGERGSYQTVKEESFGGMDSVSTEVRRTMGRGDVVEQIPERQDETSRDVLGEEEDLRQEVSLTPSSGENTKLQKLGYEGMNKEDIIYHSSTQGEYGHECVRSTHDEGEDEGGECDESEKGPTVGSLMIKCVTEEEGVRSGGGTSGGGGYTLSGDQPDMGPGVGIDMVQTTPVHLSRRMKRTGVSQPTLTRSLITDYFYSNAARTAKRKRMECDWQSNLTSEDDEWLDDLAESGEDSIREMKRFQLDHAANVGGQQHDLAVGVVGEEDEAWQDYRSGEDDWEEWVSQHLSQTAGDDLGQGEIAQELVGGNQPRLAVKKGGGFSIFRNPVRAKEEEEAMPGPHTVEDTEEGGVAGTVEDDILLAGLLGGAQLVVGEGKPTTAMVVANVRGQRGVLAGEGHMGDEEDSTALSRDLNHGPSDTSTPIHNHRRRCTGIQTHQPDVPADNLHPGMGGDLVGRGDDDEVCTYDDKGVCGRHGQGVELWKAGKKWMKRKDGTFGWRYARSYYWTCKSVPGRSEAGTKPTFILMRGSGASTSDNFTGRVLKNSNGGTNSSRRDRT